MCVEQVVEDLKGPLTNCVAATKRENDRLHCESDGEEMLWPRICLLKVNHLSAAPVREKAGQFQEHTDSGTCHQETDDPVDEGKTDGARRTQDGARYIPKHASAYTVRFPRS